jgi:superfamily II DNA/RNA helicase
MEAPPRDMDSLQALILPDLWQQQAVRALRDGKDVVVDAPTGAGKTFVFELFQQGLRGQAIYTVPTRALANDKLAEWRSKGWDVGICTGDVAERLDARVVVATLETQKQKFLRREGPRLLVIDEYQLIADSLRGASYELAIALAPQETQLLLMSGSVANPQDIVAWVERLGRKAELVQHRERPVPLEQVDLEMLPDRASANIRGWWPRMIANALAADLGPILIFAPRRRAAEQMATQLAAALPVDTGLRLSSDDEELAGPALKRLLKQRVAYHHSGLSFAQRAGLIEPLAKRGKLRVVVATMGLAAGINFSMRSVAVSGTTYYAEHLERQVRPDELLQMFGRAGRRGLDETGYVLITPQPPRMLDGRPLTLRRAEPLDWPTLLAMMQAASERGADPFDAALELSRRLFTPRELPLGVEHCKKTGPMPCGLGVDMERARFFRRGVTEMLNSRGEWQLQPKAPVDVPFGSVLVREKERWRPALSVARALEGHGFGALVRLPAEKGHLYGRELVIGSRRPNGSFGLAPALKNKLAVPHVNEAGLREIVFPRLPEVGGGRLLSIEPRGEQLVARFAYDQVSVPAWTDETGALLINPPTRSELPVPCRGCVEAAWCGSVAIENSPAYWWRQLGLIESDGRPTRRGVLFGLFHHAEGFAVAVALEDEAYGIGDLIFDLANLRAGPRFAGEDSPYGGPLGHHCQQASQRAEIPGYLTMGVPLDYGAGASEAFRAHVEHGLPRAKLLTENLKLGDFERAYMEWRSLLRHITWAPDLEWDRWRDLKTEAALMLERTDRFS